MPLKNVFEVFRNRLVENILEQEGYKKAKAFGQFEDYIKSPESATITDDRYIQRGTSYTTSAQVGQFVGPNSFSAIYHWLELKKYNLKWEDESQRSRLTFAILAKRARTRASYLFREENAIERRPFIPLAIAETRPFLTKLLVDWQRETVQSAVSDAVKKIMDGNSK